MQFVGKSKIGKLSAKKDNVYAQIRLPPKLADTIGGIADIFETERDGKRAFLLVTDQSVRDNSTVLQLGEPVVKLQSQKHLIQRLKDLESEFKEIRSALFYEEHNTCSKIKKEGGPGRIRTGDLRRVKATS